MKALCYYGPRDIRYDTVPDARLEDDSDVIVKMEKCAICGSDLHIYHGHVVSDTLSSIGHEAVGEVVETGRDVKRFRSGDKVMLAGAVGCGSCPACISGNFLRCVKGVVRGYGYGLGLDGCQAEAIRVPAADFNMAHIPDGVTVDQALMLTDNLPTAYAACLRADITPGATVVIIGLGAIGLMAVEVAFVLGASRVIAVDLNADRRAFAESMGAVACDPDGAIETVRELTDGLMADSVIEAVGLTATVNLALQLVGKTRTVSVLGVGMGPEISFPPEAYLFGVTFRVLQATEVARYWPDLIPLIQSGRLHPERMITNTNRLAEGAGAYATFDAKAEGTLKIIMVP